MRLLCWLIGHAWFCRRVDARRRYCKRCGRCEVIGSVEALWREKRIQELRKRYIDPAFTEPRSLHAQSLDDIE